MLKIKSSTAKDHQQNEKCLLTDPAQCNEEILKIKIQFFTQSIK